MTEQLEDLLRESTVRVLAGSASGAGFFVAPGKILTCAHVVRGSTDLKVRWERDDHAPELAVVSGPATLLGRGEYPLSHLSDVDYPDIALLEVAGLGDHPCVSIDDGLPTLGTDFLVFGYPEEGGSTLLAPARLTYRSLRGFQPTVFLDLASDTIRPGMSGAPVLNLRTGEVCGIVAVSKNADQPDGALAVPLSAVRGDLSEVLAANRAFHEQDRRWAEAATSSAGLQPGPANRFQLEAYLRKVVTRNSRDTWADTKRFSGPVLLPETVERELRVSGPGRPGGQETAADEAAGQYQRLVVLGEPGSGKTWLARRLARRCAQEALRALQAGQSPADVELPLYTTCSDFFQVGGSARDAAVSSALKLTDMGSASISRALQEFFTGRDGPTLLILDSLDEASGSDRPLLDADALPWRIILTSRPSSWDGQLIPQAPSETRKVGWLQPLRYPEDVEPVIAAWFAGQPERGREVAAQIARRHSLQQAATVPLMLAFFCVIGHADQPLPEFRHVLNMMVLRRVLSGGWRGGQVDSGSQPDVNLCLRALEEWAWAGAAQHPVSGTGTWIDEISTDPADRLPSAADRNALDHIAAPLGPADLDTGKLQRRFIHRSLREHLVAQHVAGLPADEAAESILPHLWYDPDWEYAAPAALVMHPQHDEVLRRMLSRVVRSDTMSLVDGERGLQGFLARVAAESTEADWSTDMARLLGGASRQLTQSSSSAAGLDAAVAWGSSKQQTRATLLGFLASYESNRQDAMLESFAGIAKLPFGQHVDQLVWLAGTADERHETREMLLRLLRDQNGGRAADYLASGLMRLEPTDQERQAARVRLLDVLASEDDGSVAVMLTDRITQLRPTDEERRAARVRLLDVLASEDGGSVAGTLTDWIVQLGASDEDRRAARVRLLDMLAGSLPRERSNADPALRSTLDLLDGGFIWSFIPERVIRLAATSQEKREAREALLSMLANPNIGSVAGKLVGGLAGLDPTAEDLDRIRTRLHELLVTQPEGLEVEELVSGLTQLAVSPTQMRDIQETLLRLLDDGGVTELYAIERAAAEIVRLAATEDQKREARQRLREALTHRGDSQIAPKIISSILRLDPAAEEKQQLLEIVLTYLRREDHPWIAGELAGLVAELEPSTDLKRDVREGLFGLLDPATYRFLSEGVIKGICQLDPTSEEKRRLRHFLLETMEALIDDGMPNESFRIFVDLGPSDEERGQMREVLLRRLEQQCQTGKSYGVDGDVTGFLVEIAVTGQEKEVTRETLVELLAVGFAPSHDRLTKLHAESMARHLEDGLARLDPLADDLQTWRTWAFKPTSRLLAAARLNSPLDAWLAALPYLPSNAAG